MTELNETLELKTDFKEEILNILLSGETTKKFKIKEMLGITEDNKKLSNLFEKQFKELIKDDVIKKFSRNSYTSNLPKDCIIGKLYFNSQGNAFLQNEETKENFFVYKENVLNALYGDLVVLEITKKATKDKKAEGRVVSVLKREVSKVIGTYMEYNNNISFVIPDNTKINRDIYIPEKYNLGAKPYDKVVVEIYKYPTYKKEDERIQIFNPEGKITEIIGMTGEKGVDSLSVIKANDLRKDFPAEVIKESSELSSNIEESEIKNRLDLREEIVFTIDGEDSKDLDDAISIKKTESGYELGVHIADVSHYVQEGKSIDKEAILRGTSVYLIDQVIPMLPKILSNNLCSLNPLEDKLTLSCIMYMNEEGVITKSKIVESVINSNAKLVYSEVTAFLENPEENSESFREKFSNEVADSLIIGKELSLKLRNLREKRGSIEFDTIESKIVLDENGKVLEIHPYERGISNDMIEEFMLAANETVAKKFDNLKIPFIYRVHDYPRAEKLEIFDRIAKNYGFTINLSGERHVEPKVIQQFLEDNKDREEIPALKELLLHSMQQARYSSTCTGHFGLASNHYCHFTSPIRRYPDLQIHRIIKKSLHGEINAVTKAKYEKITEEIAEYCSKAERRADEAERELDRNKMYEYILENSTKIYEGSIRSFNKKGMFVTLDNSSEGFIKPFDYEFNEDLYQAKSNGQVYKLGDRLTLKFKNANKTTKEILFDIIEKEERTL